MTEAQTAPTVTSVRFNPRSNTHAGSLARLHRDYLLEETTRLGYHAPGMPLAAWLNTFLITVDDIPVGYCAADHTRYAIELIYIEPTWRGRGLASHLLRDLMATCPQPMQIKAPLSPGGEALARTLGLEVSEPTAEELATAMEIARDLNATIARHCQHRRKSGNPSKPCLRCYRNVINTSAANVVLTYCRAVRLGVA
ncbi:GNAT family N-acetyltransferase [Streptomyces sp. NPDC018833]|uniref:GNAT family N-acetyltransferase n=1 Tax=Streptomyces sp. NPDC018833 TaxID=3365053 RepID=UPI00379F6125